MHQSLLVALQTVQRQASAYPHGSALWIDIGCMLIGLQCLAIVALVIECRALAIPGIEIAWIDAQSLFVCLERLRIVLHLQVLVAFTALLAHGSGSGMRARDILLINGAISTGASGNNGGIGHIAYLLW